MCCWRTFMWRLPVLHQGGELTFASTFGGSQRTRLACFPAIAHLLKITSIFWGLPVLYRNSLKVNMCFIQIRTSGSIWILFLMRICRLFIFVISCQCRWIKSKWWWNKNAQTLQLKCNHNCNWFSICEWIWGRSLLVLMLHWPDEGGKRFFDFLSSWSLLESGSM